MQAHIESQVEKSSVKTSEITDQVKDQAPTDQATHEGHSFLSKVKEGIDDISSSITGKIHDLKDRVTKDIGNLTKDSSERGEQLKETMEKPVPEEKVSDESEKKEGHSTMEKLSHGWSDINSKISETVSHLKDKIMPAKVDEDTGLISNKDLNAHHGVAVIPSEELKTVASNEGFIEVKTGFSETVTELKEEIRKEEFGTEKHTNNPFTALTGGEASVLSQPLLPQEIVGGDVREVIADPSTISTEVPDLSDKTSVLDRIKEGWSDTTSKINDTISGLKDKLLPHHENKRNEADVSDASSKVVGGDITNKISEGLENAGGKSAAEKVKEAWADTTSKISDKFADIKDKIMPGGHADENKLSKIISEVSDKDQLKKSIETVDKENVSTH